MLETGECLLDTYRVEGLLGKGGTGTVYLVTHIRTGQRLAAKEINESEGTVFTAEYETLRTLHHEGLPRIIDLYVGDHRRVLIMEYVEGITAKQMLISRREGFLEPAVVKAMVLQLCSVLDYLHRQKPPIIYRDLKPSNIMVRPNGRVVLVDFGTARRYERDKSGDTVYMGTPGFAAPEQVMGTHQTTARTDIYSLGATIRYLLTGTVGPEGRLPACKDRAELRTGKALLAAAALCMQAEPSKRPESVRTVEKRICHPVRNRGVMAAGVVVLAVLLAAGGLARHQYDQQQRELQLAYCWQQGMELFFGDGTAVKTEDKAEAAEWFQVFLQEDDRTIQRVTGYQRQIPESLYRLSRWHQRLGAEDPLTGEVVYRLPELLEDLAAMREMAAALCEEEDSRLLGLRVCREVIWQIYTHRQELKEQENTTGMTIAEEIRRLAQGVEDSSDTAAGLKGDIDQLWEWIGL